MNDAGSPSFSTRREAPSGSFSFRIHAAAAELALDGVAVGEGGGDAIHLIYHYGLARGVFRRSSASLAPLRADAA